MGEKYDLNENLPYSHFLKQYENRNTAFLQNLHFFCVAVRPSNAYPPKIAHTGGKHA